MFRDSNIKHEKSSSLFLKIRQKQEGAGGVGCMVWGRGGEIIVGKVCLVRGGGGWLAPNKLC